jgi:hypothetical protein
LLKPGYPLKLKFCMQRSVVGEAGYELYVEAINGIVSSLEKLDMTQNWNVYLPAFNARALAQLEVCEHAIARRLTVKQPEKEGCGQVKLYRTMQER